MVGGNRQHAMIMFATQEDVNKVMSQRIHRIDGKQVIFHRSVPNQVSSRKKCDSPHLIVSSMDGQVLDELQIREYFLEYGKIDEIRPKNGGSASWVITFD